MAVTLHLSGNAGDVTPRERRQSTRLLLPVFFFCFVCQDGKKGGGEKVHKI